MKKVFTILTFSLLFFQMLNAQEWTNEHPLTVQMAPSGVMFDDNDNLFFIVQGAGLFEVVNGASNLLSTATASLDLTTIQFDGQDFWVGGYGGGSTYSNSTWENFLQGSDIYDLDLTNGAVWAAIEAQGASYFNGTSWESYTTSDGISGQWHTCIAQNNQGEVFLGSTDWSNASAFINRFDGTNWTPIEIPNLEEITSIFVDSQDNVWVGGKGLLKFDGTDWTDYTTSILDRSIYSITEAPDGKIYFGMISGGVGFVEGDVATLIPVVDGLGFTGRPNGITTNSLGEVYFCMGPTNGISTQEYGLYKYGQEITSSTNEISNMDVVLFPNPIQDNFSLQLDAENYSIQIFNTAGKIVIENSHSSKGETISIAHLPAGMYIAKIKVGNQITSKKLVKK